MAQEEAARCKLHIIVEPDREKSVLFIISITGDDGIEGTAITAEVHNMNAARAVLKQYQEDGYLEAVEVAGTLVTLQQHGKLPQDGEADDVSASPFLVDVMRYIGLTPEEIRINLTEMGFNESEIDQLTSAPFDIIGVDARFVPEGVELTQEVASSADADAGCWTIDPAAALALAGTGTGISE